MVRKPPYEINTTWFSALNRYSSQEDIAFQVKRFVASRSIALVLRGVPGIYLHGLIGSLNDVETVLKSKSIRDINRQVIDEQDLLAALKNPKSKLSYSVGVFSFSPPLSGYVWCDLVGLQGRITLDNSAHSGKRQFHQTSYETLQTSVRAS